ncbi:MAG: hypothetical protein ACI4OP_04400 [Candidatus Coprovivens sp.]
MEMTYTNNILYINIEDRINFSLIKKLKYRLFYLIDSYGIDEIILNINDDHYDTSLILELIDEYNMKYNGKLTVK